MKRKRRGAPLGQHFLTGLWAARALARAAGITKSDTVLEIGPGKGALTRELLAMGREVVAIEKDENLVELLSNKFSAEVEGGSLHIIKSDIRDVSAEKFELKDRQYILAANIPYYITGEIIRKFLTSKSQPKTIALLVQKEVAQRIVGGPAGGGSASGGKESILSLSVKAYGDPKLVKKVPKGNFSPPPSVDSAILVIKNISRDFFSDIDEKSFFEVVRAGFSSKRKFLAGNLAKKFGTHAREALSACGIPEKSRAEDVPLEKWECLAEQLRASNV